MERTLIIVSAALTAVVYLLASNSLAFAQTTVTVPVLPADTSKELVITYRAEILSTTPDSVTEVRSPSTSTSASLSTNVITEAVEPLTPFEFRLGSPAYFMWNSFLDMENVVSVFNAADGAIIGTANLINSEGQILEQQSLSVSAAGETDVLLSSFAGFSSPAVGLLQVNLASGFDGQGMYYRNSSNSDGLEFMTGKPLQAPLQGNSFVFFNTIQPSRRQLHLDNHVTNWLQLANLNQTEAKAFIVSFFSDSGQNIRTENLSIPPLGRRDIEAGHITPGLGNVGLITITPLDSSSPYLAQTIRFGASSPTPDLAKLYHFALSLEARSQETDVRAVPVSNGGGGESWFVIANVGDTQASYQVDTYAFDGSLRDSTTVTLNSLSQAHLYTTAILEGSESGVSIVTPLNGGRYIAESNVYFFHPLTDEVTAAYGEITRHAMGASLVGGYNTFLSQFNYLKVFNLNESTFAASNLSLEGSFGALGASPVALGARSGFETGIHTFTFSPSGPSFGPLMLDQPASGTYLAQVLRYQLASDGSIAAAELLAIR